MVLDVYSDVICPWCYLGHRRLEAAIDAMGADGEAIELRWRAFQLDARASSEPGELRPAVDARYGPGAFEVMSSRLRSLGAREGIDYRFDRALRVNTLDAHRLIKWAQHSSPELTAALVERLFSGYFTDGSNLADRAVLLSLAGEVGLDSDRAAEVLATDAWTDAVLADRAEALEAGISGVPAVVYNGFTVIAGAQDTDTMELILRRLLTKVG